MADAGVAGFFAVEVFFADVVFLAAVLVFFAVVAVVFFAAGFLTAVVVFFATGFLAAADVFFAAVAVVFFAAVAVVFFAAVAVVFFADAVVFFAAVAAFFTGAAVLAAVVAFFAVAAVFFAAEVVFFAVGMEKSLLYMFVEFCYLDFTSNYASLQVLPVFLSFSFPRLVFHRRLLYNVHSIKKPFSLTGRTDQTARRIIMDIQKIISDLVGKLTGNKDLIAKFTSDPLGLIKELLGIDLDPSQLGDVVKGVTGQLGDITGDAAKEAGGILNKILGIFKKN